MNYETAVHEAGHLVLAKHFGYHGAVIEDAGDGYLGRVNIGTTITDGFFEIRLGGVAAHKRISNDWAIAFGGSHSDLAVLENLPADIKRRWWSQTDDLIDQYWNDVLRIAGEYA